MSIKKHCDELHHVLSKIEHKRFPWSPNKEIPRSSQLQKLNIECNIIDSFISNKSGISALKYLLEVTNTALSDWNWIEEISKRSMKTKFQTDTIHKISTWIVNISNPFEASLIYQICNIKDNGVKEQIKKSINNYYAINNSHIGDERQQNTIML